MMKRRIVIIFIIVLIFAFVAVVLFEQSRESYRSIYISDKMEVFVSKTRSYKSGLIINDSLVLPSMTKRIINDSNLYAIRYKYFGSLEAPFKIYKKQNNDTIVIIKDYEIIYYKLND